MTKIESQFPLSPGPNYSANANLIFLKLAPIKSFCQSMCSSLFFKFQFTCGGLQGWFSCRNFCSLSKDSLLGMRVAMIPGSASRRCRGSGGTSCCTSWSLGLCSATGPSVDTWDARVLARLGVACFLRLTKPELPLGLRVGVASAAVTRSACYKRVRYI